MMNALCGAVKFDAFMRFRSSHRPGFDAEHSNQNFGVLLGVTPEGVCTVALFYRIYTTTFEIGEPFGALQGAKTMAVAELTHAPALDDQMKNALVAFRKTLTDA